jgi:hypothetical protein
MTLEEADEYINYNIKLGIWEAEDFEEMTPAERINFVKYQMARADDLMNKNE